MFLPPRSWSVCSCLQWPKTWEETRKTVILHLILISLIHFCFKLQSWRCCGRTTHQVFSVWWYSHRKDVGCMSYMAVLSTFPSTRNRMKFLTTLNIPYTQNRKPKPRLLNKTLTFLFVNTVFYEKHFRGFHWILTLNDGAVFGSREDTFVIWCDDQTGNWKFMSS